MRNTQKGFTLIELLVVIAIIGLLSTLAVVALNSARERSRDSKRVSDMRQIQTALEMYYADHNGYPAVPGTGADEGVLGLAGTMRLCGDSAPGENDGGFIGGSACAGTTYMGLVPTAPSPADGDCGGTPDNNRYVYDLGTGGRSYTIDFCLGGNVGDLTSGPNQASESGIVTVAGEVGGGE